MTTQTKKTGRPVKSDQGVSSASTSIKRNENLEKPREYESIKSKAVMMLLQKSITIYDENTNSVREIRYCENENSIFKDEQNPNSVKSPIVFRMGRLFVQKEQPNLAKFLDAHPGNEANGGSKFRLIDTVKSAELDIENEFLINDAVSMLRSKSVDDLLAVALSYNINVDRPISEIKHDLLIKAKASPVTFIQSFDNPVVLMKAKIKQAVNYQIISAKPDAVKWFDTGKHIISVPAGQDPVDVFVRYCMTEAAAPVVAEIERQLD